MLFPEMDDMNDERVPTGVERLDNLIGGGFRQGKSYLISGETGMGKTIFGLQFIMKGLELGENGVYVTVDEKPESLIEDAESFGFDLKAGIDQKKITIMDFSTHFEQLRNRWTEIDARNIIGELNKYVRRIDAKRLVIDPIAPFFIKEGKMWEVQSFIRSLFYTMESLGTTTLLTSVIPPGTSDFSQYGIEEIYASGIIVLSVSEIEKMRPKRIMVVRKMRCSYHSLDPNIIDFEYGKGIVIQQTLAEKSKKGSFVY
jgi:circadian clock protein KaiC